MNGRTWRFSLRRYHLGVVNVLLAALRTVWSPRGRVRNRRGIACVVCAAAVLVVAFPSSGLAIDLGRHSGMPGEYVDVGTIYSSLMPNLGMRYAYYLMHEQSRGYGETMDPPKPPHQSLISGQAYPWSDITSGAPGFVAVYELRHGGKASDCSSGNYYNGNWILNGDCSSVFGQVRVNQVSTDYVPSIGDLKRGRIGTGEYAQYESVVGAIVVGRRTPSGKYDVQALSAAQTEGGVFAMSRRTQSAVTSGTAFSAAFGAGFTEVVGSFWGFPRTVNTYLFVSGASVLTTGQTSAYWDYVATVDAGTLESNMDNAQMTLGTIDDVPPISYTATSAGLGPESLVDSSTPWWSYKEKVDSTVAKLRGSVSGLVAPLSDLFWFLTPWTE